MNESNTLLHTIHSLYIHRNFSCYIQSCTDLFFFLFFDPLIFKQNCLISIIAMAIRIFPLLIASSFVLKLSLT